MKRIISLSGVVLVAMAFQTAALAAFTPGNIVIYRVGGGANQTSGSTLTNTGNIVWLDECTPPAPGDTSLTVIQSVMMPTNFFGGYSPLIDSAQTTASGLMSRSDDGRFLALTGYGATIGQITNFALTAEDASTVPHVVALVDGFGHIDTSTVQTNNLSDGEGIRSAATRDGTNLWFAGDTTGIKYAARGSSLATQLSSFITLLRQVSVYSNQLYFSDQTGTSLRLGIAGTTPPPTTNGTFLANLPGFVTNTNSPYAFVFFNLKGFTNAFDTLYVADDGAAGNTAGVYKWSLQGTNWVNVGSITAFGARGLTGISEISGGTTNVHLWITNGGSISGGSTLYPYVDSTGYNADPAGDANQYGISPIPGLGVNGFNFRGIAMAPVGGEVFPSGPGRISVGPITDFFDSQGLTGGPFPLTKNYSVANPGTDTVTWVVSATNNWVGFSTLGSTLIPGASITVTVSFNANANSLTAGTNLSSILFTNTTSGNNGFDVTTRPATLVINDQTVTPAGSLSVSGPPGGPFTPLTKIYTLSNGVAPGTISWTVSHAASATWVSLSATSGTLAGGASTNITVSIVTNAANALAAGNYSDTVSFSNATANTLVGARSVSLADGFTFFFDDFSTYNAGPVVGQQGWTQLGTGTTPALQVSGGALVFPGGLTAAGQTAYKNFPLLTNPVIYAGMLMKVTSVVSNGDNLANTGPAYVGTVYTGNNGTTTSGTFPNYRFTFKSPDAGFTNFVIGTRNNGQAGAPWNYGTQSFAIGAQIRLVLVTDVNGSNSTLYVNPTSSNLGAQTPYVVAMGGTNALAFASDQGFGSLGFSEFGSATVPSDGAAFNKIAVSTNYADVYNFITTAGPPPTDPFTAWQNQYFTIAELGTPSFSGPNADPLGKGMSNTNQFLAGFNPTNASAYVHITAISRVNAGTDIRVDYLGASGDSSRTQPGPLLSRTNVLEFTAGASGNYNSNSFASTGVTNILSGGIGLGTQTNMVDPGGATHTPARYYRVRVLVP